jgi:hypothetical protein
MKSVKFVALFGALSLVFMGCPYETKVPLDPADKAVKLDNDMIGAFEEKGDDSYTRKCEKDGNQYRITKKSTEDSESEPTVYIGWASMVGDKQFLNVYEQDYSSDRAYYLYLIDKKSADRFKFKAVTDNITEEFTTGEELKAFVKKHMELSFFYNKDDEKTFYKEE